MNCNGTENRNENANRNSEKDELRYLLKEILNDVKQSKDIKVGEILATGSVLSLTNIIGVIAHRIQEYAEKIDNSVSDMAIGYSEEIIAITEKTLESQTLEFENIIWGGN